MGIMDKLVWYIIPIIVLVLIIMFSYVGETSAFPKVKKTIEGIKSYLPDVETGAEEILGKTPEIPEEQQAAIQSLADTIAEMLDSEKINCFARYSILPPLQDKGTIIEISEEAMVVKTAGGKQVLTDFTNKLTGIVGYFQPCVIAGNENVVSNFDKLFLNEKGWAEKEQAINSLGLEHYTLVDLIIIGYDLNGFNENRISYSLTKKFNDFEDYGYLYKPEEGVICFFPTVDGNNVCDGSSEDGLDDDCLAGDPKEDISVPNQIEKGSLIEC